MIRSDLRLGLKEVLVEPVGGNDYWDDSQLNRYLNQGLAFVESRILMIDPLAFIFSDAFALTANIDLYPLPPGLITLVRLENANGRLRRKHESVIARQNFKGATAALPTEYGRLGRYVRLSGKPTTTTANAMQVTYVPTLAMATDSDSSGIHENLDWLVILRAAVIALTGTAEKEKLALTRGQLSEGLNDISLYYRPDADSALQLRPDYDIIDGDDRYGFDPNFDETR